MRSAVHRLTDCAGSACQPPDGVTTAVTRRSCGSAGQLVDQLVVEDQGHQDGVGAGLAAAPGRSSRRRGPAGRRRGPPRAPGRRRRRPCRSPSGPAAGPTGSSSPNRPGASRPGVDRPGAARGPPSGTTGSRTRAPSWVKAAGSARARARPVGHVGGERSGAGQAPQERGASARPRPRPAPRPAAPGGGPGGARAARTWRRRPRARWSSRQAS